MLPLMLSVAWAGSLDNLEVGGPWGTPTATDATAVWWNPAGMGSGSGTRIMLEYAPTTAEVQFERSDPGGGLDTYLLNGGVPYFGAVSDFTVEGLGVGVGLAVPYARGGESINQGGDGPGAYAMINGHTQVVYLTGALAYRPVKYVSAGFSVSMVSGSWDALVKNTNLADLDAEIDALEQESGYTDDMFEDPDYAVLLDYYEGLEARSVTYGFGLMGHPHESLDVGVSASLGTWLAHSGPMRLYMGCPPQSDTLGRFGAEAFGVCDATFEANAGLGYRLPHRVNWGVAWRPIEGLRAELMGGWVGWSAFTDFMISIADVEELNELENPETAELVNREQRWARANEDSFWMGLDGKYQITDRWLAGGRLLYDRSAVPDAALSPNNYDTNTLMISGLAAFKPVKFLELGLSFTRQVAATRVVTESGFGVTLDEESATDERFFYPHMAGTYSAWVNRFGLQLRSAF